MFPSFFAQRFLLEALGGKDTGVFTSCFEDCAISVFLMQQVTFID